MSKAARTWTLETAIPFIKDLRRQLKPIGFSVGLTGSVLTHGVSTKDLDIIVFPDSTRHPLRSQGLLKLNTALEKLGLKLRWDMERVHAAWRKQGSDDTKHVEVWDYGARRVDIFFLE